LTGYKTKRRIVQVLTTLLVIGIPFFNIVRIDVPKLRFYFFNTVLWVDELNLIFLVVIWFSLVVLFFTLIYGRLWCGWGCPQTAISDLALWLDKSISKPFRKLKGTGKVIGWVLSSIAMLAVSLFISLNVIIYFIDPYRLFNEISTWSQGNIVNVIILIIMLLNFLNMRLLRHKFCLRACPYGMLQTLFVDELTQIIMFDTNKSELCIDCSSCVRSCVMGIDIRPSPYQTDCNSCGDCIDACEQVMKKKNETSIIKFSQGVNPIEGGFFKRTGFFQGKRLILIIIILLTTFGVYFKLSTRSPLHIIVIQDRFTLMREGKDGLVYNDYRMKITNRNIEDGYFRFNCVNRENGKTMKVQKKIEEIFLKSGETATIGFSIGSDGNGLKSGPNKIDCTAFNVKNKEIKIMAEIVFFMPEKKIEKKS
jgi:cytochrome c oxidase accessory protein FixG